MKLADQLNELEMAERVLARFAGKTGTILVPRYMRTFGLAREQLAMISDVQREWAAKTSMGVPQAARLPTGVPFDLSPRG